MSATWWSWSVCTLLYCIGAYHCKLRHVGWERCCHGLTSRPRESATEPFFSCSVKFARRVPFWALPVPGHVADSITAGVQAAQVGEAEVARWDVGNSGPGRKRIRLNRKKPSTPRGIECACSSTCLEEVALLWVDWFFWC